MTKNTVDINVGKSHAYSGGSSADGAGTAALSAKIEKLQKALNSEISTRETADNSIREALNSKLDTSAIADYVTYMEVEQALADAKITVATSYVTVKNDKTQLSLSLTGNVLSLVKYDVPEIKTTIQADKHDIDPTETTQVSLSFTVEADTDITVAWYDDGTLVEEQQYPAQSGSSVDVVRLFDNVSYDNSNAVHAVVVDARGYEAITDTFDMVNVFSKYIYYKLIDADEFPLRDDADAQVTSMTAADWKALTTKQHVSPAASNNATFTISDAGQYYIYFALQRAYGHNATCVIDGNSDLINLDEEEDGVRPYYISGIEIDNTEYNVYIASTEVIGDMDSTPVQYIIS